MSQPHPESLENSEELIWIHLKRFAAAFWRKYGRRFAVIFAVLLTTLVLAYRPILRSLTWPLRVDDGPHKADVIVVLAGGGGRRVRHGVKLWRQNYSRSGKILMAGGPLFQDVSWSSVMKQYAVKLGVPEAQILTQTRSTTTVTDAEETLKILKKLNYKTILLVTDAYHSRRARYVFRRIAEPDMTVWCASLPMPKKDWWERDILARYLLSEYLKWIWTLL